MALRQRSSRLSRSDANPIPRYMDKTMQPQGRNDRYDDHWPNTVQQGRYTVLPTMGWEPRQGSSHGGCLDRLKALTPTIGVVALSPTKRPGGRRPRTTTYYGYDASRNLETTMKTMMDTALHRTADEPPMCLQCLPRPARSTTSDPVATWPQDHDDSHTWASIRRWCSLQAKLAKTSLRLSTLRSGEPPLCNEPWPRTLYKGS
jgi:hypothetical protein